MNEIIAETRAEQVLQTVVPVSAENGKQWLDLGQKIGEVRSTTDRPESKEIIRVEDLSDLVPGMINVVYADDESVEVTLFDETKGTMVSDRITVMKEREARIHPKSTKYEISDDGETLVIFPTVSGTPLLDMLGYHMDDIGEDEAGMVALEEAGGFSGNIIETFRPIEDNDGLLFVDPTPIPTPKQN